MKQNIGRTQKVEPHISDALQGDIVMASTASLQATLTDTILTMLIFCHNTLERRLQRDTAHCDNAHIHW